MTDLPVNWQDGIGQSENAAWLNAVGAAVNASTHRRPLIEAVTSSATPAINTDNGTLITISGQAVPITSMSSGMTGTPIDGQELTLRIKDNGSPQAIVWGAKWRGVGVTLPTITFAGGVMYVEAKYNSGDSVFDVQTVRKQTFPVRVTGSASAADVTVAIPTHQPGDMITVCAFNNLTNSLMPAPPTASGTVPAWAKIDSLTNACSVVTYEFIATANNHTTGSWTNTTSIAVVVLRGESTTAALPYGAHAMAVSAASGTSASTPSVTVTNPNGTSALLYFYAHRAATAWGAAPTGCTRLTAVTGSAICVNSKDDTTSDGPFAQTLTGTAVSALAAVVEVIVAT